MADAPGNLSIPNTQTSSPSARVRFGSLWPLLMFMAACDCSGTAQTSLSISPDAATVSVGSEQDFVALATVDDGSPEPVSEKTTWSSSDPSIATVDARGRAQAKAPGLAVITASYDGLSATATLTVTGPPLRSIVVQPEEPPTGAYAASLPSGTQVLLRAIGTYADESTADLTAQAVWSSNATAIATVSSATAERGRVKGVSPGIATIVASVGDVSGSADIEVTSAVLASIAITQGDVINAPGGSRQFTAHGVLTDGRPQDLGAGITWSLGPGSAVTLDEDGLARVVGPLGSQQEIIATLPGSGFSTSVMLYVRRYVYASTNRRGDLSEQQGTAQRGILSLTASDADGSLTEIPDSFVTLSFNDSAFGGAMHPSGRFVYFPSSAGHANDSDFRPWAATSGRLMVYRVDPLTGHLSRVESHELEAGGTDAAIDPSGRFLVLIANQQGATNGRGGTITLYRINADTGRLTELGRRTGVAGETDRAALRQVTFNPVHPYVYVASTDSFRPSAGVFAMSYGDAGLTPVPGANAYQDTDSGYYNFIEGIAAHPSGAFVFPSNLSSAGGYVASLAVADTTGELSRVNHLMNSGVNSSRSDVDPSGENLYVASVYGVRHYINSDTGTLTEAPTPYYPSGNSATPGDVTVDPLGRFLYVATSLRNFTPSSAGHLLSYSIGTNGELTETSKLPFSVFGVVTTP